MIMIGVSNITNRTDPNSLKSRVFVGNLNTVHMSKTELESIFVKYGAIIGISIHKGYAFIQYANEASARAAVVGEDSKSYYNMALDVTIASEPKNRKRGRSNINANVSTWTNLSSPNLSDLALQAQTLTNLANNPILSSLQQLGLEGIMGQPNFAQFAAAASSVLAGASQLGGLGVVSTPAPAVGMRSKHVRSTNPQNFSQSTPTAHSSSSSSAKRTRLEGGMNNAGQFGTGGHGSLPIGARGQNLVSLVSPSDSVNSQAAQKSGAARTLSTQKSSGQNHPTASSTGGIQSRTIGSPATMPVKTDKKSLNTSAPVTKPQQIPPPKKSATELHRASPEATSGNSSTSARSAAEDILICGNCRRLFDQVDELISHKMAGCSLSHISCEACRCRSGEPENLECAYCGAAFRSAWGLMHHCHNDHGLTIYSLPSPTPSPNSSHGTYFTSETAGKPSRIVRSPEPSVLKVDTDEKSVLKAKSPIPKVSASVSDCSCPADDQEVSDWEADRDTCDVNEETRSLVDKCHEASASNSLCSHNGDNRNDGTAQSPNDGEDHGSVESPRRRRGEYGRHETMVDEEDEDDDDRHK